MNTGDGQQEWYPGEVKRWLPASKKHKKGCMTIVCEDGDELTEQHFDDPDIIFEKRWPKGCAAHELFEVGKGCAACNALRPEEGAGAGAGAAFEEEEVPAAAQHAHAQQVAQPRHDQEAAASHQMPRFVAEDASATLDKEAAERHESRAAEPEAPAPAFIQERAAAAGRRDAPARLEERQARPCTRPATEELPLDAPHISSPYRLSTASASATVDAAAEAAGAVTASVLAEEAETVAQAAEARQQRLKPSRPVKCHKREMPCWRETKDEEGITVSEMQNGFTPPPDTAWSNRSSTRQLRSAAANAAANEDQDPEREVQFGEAAGEQPPAVRHLTLTREPHQECGDVCHVEHNGTTLQFLLPLGVVVGAQFMVTVPEAGVGGRGDDESTPDLQSIATAFEQVIEAVQRVYARPTTAAAISTDRQGVLSALVDGMHAAISELQEHCPPRMSVGKFSLHNHRMAVMKTLASKVFKPSQGSTVLKADGFLEFCGWLLGMGADKQGAPPSRWDELKRTSGRDTGIALPRALRGAQNLALLISYCATGTTDPSAFVPSAAEVEAGTAPADAWEEVVVALVSRMLRGLLTSYNLVDKGAHDQYLKDMAEIIARMRLHDGMSKELYDKLLSGVFHMPYRSKHILGGRLLPHAEDVRVRASLHAAKSSAAAVPVPAADEAQGFLCWQ